MELLIPAFIIIAIIILLLVSRLLSNPIKIFTKIIFILIIFLIILTALVYKDVLDMKDSFLTKNNTFYLYENETLYTAITMKPIQNQILSIDSFNYFTKDEISLSEKTIQKQRYDLLIKNVNKVFIMNPLILKKEYNLDLGEELDSEELLEIIKSEKAFELLAEKTKEYYGMSKEQIIKGFQGIYEDEETLKGYLFAGLIANYFQKQESNELRKNIKEKTLEVYPKTISFRIIKYLPNI